MVQVETAQEILIGLALTAVLGHDQPRDHLQQLAGAQLGPVFNLILGHGTHRGRGGITRQPLIFPRDVHAPQVQGLDTAGHGGGYSRGCDQYREQV